MLRPIDMQTAFQALPELARTASSEQAGLLYRTVQELGQARMENLLRQGRVESAQAAQAQVFRPINREDEEGKRHRNSSARESSDREKRLASREQQLYGVAMRHIFRRATLEEGAGRNLDLSA